MVRMDIILDTYSTEYTWQFMSMLNFSRATLHNDDNETGLIAKKRIRA